MILIDSHVHIYKCFDLQTFFSAALSHFTAQAKHFGQEKDFTALLLLTEAKNENWFHYLAGYARTGYILNPHCSPQWSFHPTHESCSLQLQCSGNHNLFLIAGRQIATKEKLEVLAIATDRLYEDGTSIEEVIQSAENDGAIPVIPYGF